MERSMKHKALWEAYMEIWDLGAPMEGAVLPIRQRAEKERSTYEAYRYTVEKKLGDTMKIRWG